MTPRSSSPDPVLAAAEFRRSMAAWPSGVSVVSSALPATPRTPVGCTVTALVSLSADPPLLLVSLAEHSRTLAAIRARERFAVCVLSTEQRELGPAFATGDPAERFARADYGWVAGVPVLRAAATAMVCAVHRAVPVADHVLVIGHPLWLARNPAATPTVWFDHATWTLTP